MPTTSLSPHFTLEEMIVSQTAARLGVSNAPDATVEAELRRTATLLEEVRTLLGGLPIQITSGYRSPELNAHVPGSSKTSAHMFGRAADIICPQFGDPLAVCRKIAATQGIVFDQLIYEFASWTHIAVAGPGSTARRQVLTIDKTGTRPGLPA